VSLTEQMAATEASLAQAKADGVPQADALRGLRTARGGQKLTARQRARVRELMEDEGESRASAVAWVLNMEPEGV
jgi:hypothetical protein